MDMEAGSLDNLYCYSGLESGNVRKSIPVAGFEPYQRLSKVYDSTT